MVLLLIAFGLPGLGFVISESIERVLLWNIRIVFWFTQPFPLLGYDQVGRPMSEGSPAGLFVGLLGFIIGFCVYPIIAFVFLTIRDRRQLKRV